MTALTIADVIARAGNLIPNARAASPSRLSTHAAYVLTPVGMVPEPFRAAQAARTDAYLLTGNRITPGHAVSYWVESYGRPIAWVTLDGRTHYAGTVEGGPLAFDSSVNGRSPQLTTMLRHRDAIRAEWPDLFLFDGQGDVIRVQDSVTDDDWRAASNAPEEDGPHPFEPRDKRAAVTYGLSLLGCDYCGQPDHDPIHTAPRV